MFVGNEEDDITDLLTNWSSEPEREEYRPAGDECAFWVVTYAIMAICAFTIIFEYL